MIFNGCGIFLWIFVPRLSPKIIFTEFLSALSLDFFLKNLFLPSLISTKCYVIKLMIVKYWGENFHSPSFLLIQNSGFLPESSVLSLWNWTNLVVILGVWVGVKYGVCIGVHITAYLSVCPSVNTTFHFHKLRGVYTGFSGPDIRKVNIREQTPLYLLLLAPFRHTNALDKPTHKFRSTFHISRNRYMTPLQDRRSDQPTNRNIPLALFRTNPRNTPIKKATGKRYKNSSR